MNRPAAFRVGLFTLVGTALLMAAVLWVSRDWFGATETMRLRFAGSVYGLQPGAPVVMVLACTAPMIRMVRRTRCPPQVVSARRVTGAAAVGEPAGLLVVSRYRSPTA
jgi:hypothetical protein